MLAWFVCAAPLPSCDHYIGHPHHPLTIFSPPSLLPGHAIEIFWMIMDEAIRTEDKVSNVTTPMALRK
jgi:hypothetical protein